MAGKKISQIMDKKLVAVAPTTTIKSAIKLVTTSGVDVMPVVSAGKLIGVVNEADLLAFSSSHNEDELEQSIEQLMTGPLFVEEDEDVSSAVKKMQENDAKRLPVVDSRRSMKCKGFVSATELLKETKPI